MSKNNSKLDALGSLIAQLLEEEAARLIAHPEQLRQRVSTAVQQAMETALAKTVAAIVEDTTETAIRKAVKKGAHSLSGNK
jgi:molecular chaperone GrpE (heat shock protein)